VSLSSFPAAVERARPRLESAEDGYGVVPNYRPRGTPPDAPRAEPVEGPLAQLRARLAAARATALAAFRPWPHFPDGARITLVTRGELDAINADLEAVRVLNATLGHQQRSERMARWPSPVFRPTVLHSWRDLHDALAIADAVLAAAERNASSWFAQNA
jgi:hypothetical protein